MLLHLGCRAQVLDKIGNDDRWDHQIRYIGANIYYQMSTTFNQKMTDDDSIGKDLFVEQLVVCQMLGVLQCFDAKFLDIVLKMQDVSGCWKQTSKDEDNDARDLVTTEKVIKDDQQMIIR